MTANIPSVAKLLDLSGRTAIVTGASGGIGSGIARRFGEAGAHVICHYHGNKAAAEAVAAAITSAGGKATSVKADVSAAKDITSLIEAAGGADILVNNAGIQPVKMFNDLSESDWTEMMAANVAGPFLLVRAFADALRKSGKGGAVVNIASIEGHNPAPGHGHYATSKAALLMFTKAAAMELGEHGIRVNSISPGLIHRGGIEQGWPEGVGRWKKAAALGRLGRPEDIADAALFLASDAARWITGTDLIVDGGVMARPTW
ncbi:MAG TPA: glucose 1-dehydrogenase [Rhizobiaceae bacterium]|nr:glucose 1-dehydrogenase [Rhizobiaceae bacterium]